MTHTYAPRLAAGLLTVLSIDVSAAAQTLTFRNSRDLLAGEPAALAAQLDAARPAPLSRKDVDAILGTLPPEGEITAPGPQAQRKVDAVRQLLTATGRDWYAIKVIDLPQAAVAVHARAVILISAPTLELVSAAELQALAAHEIGHEYVWMEWERARRGADQERLRQLELACDAIAAITLHGLGMNPSALPDGLEKLTRFNRERFGEARNEKNYPRVTERRAFAREIQQWLCDFSVCACALADAASPTSTGSSVVDLIY